jgi:hypothetical protein
MKSSLWVVIVVVTGIVGFLVGYSVSAGTAGPQHAAKAAPAGHQAESAPGYGSQPAAKDAAPGYGAQPASTKAVSAGGYR